MNLKYDFIGLDEAYAQLTHIFKGVEFKIIINENIDTEKSAHNAIAFFRTPKGKYRHDFWMSPEFLIDVGEIEFLDEACRVAYDSFETKFGWT